MSDQTRTENGGERHQEPSDEDHQHDPVTRSAVAALRRYSPEVKKWNVYKELPFLKGRLFMIEWWDKDKKRFEYSVYVRGDKFEHASVFSEMEQMADYMSEHRTHLERVTDPSTVTAVLAVAVLIALVILQFTKGTDINPIFSNALTLVLGFYFGQKRG
jgi:hypothetical protein